MEGSGYTEQTPKRGRTGQGVQKIPSVAHGKKGEGVLNPVPMIPLKGATLGGPCAGVCDGKSAKAIRTFVLGH